MKAEYSNIYLAIAYFLYIVTRIFFFFLDSFPVIFTVQKQSLLDIVNW